MEKSYNFRIYPDDDQKVLINKTFGCTRFLFNHFLGKRRNLYNTNKETLNYNELFTEQKFCQS